MLYAVGSPQASAAGLFRAAGGILMITGLAAAVLLLLSAVNVLVTEKADQLWPLLLICLPAGVASVLIGEWSRKRRPQSGSTVVGDARPQ